MNKNQPLTCNKCGRMFDSHIRHSHAGMMYPHWAVNECCLPKELNPVETEGSNLKDKEILVALLALFWV